MLLPCARQPHHIWLAPSKQSQGSFAPWHPPAGNPARVYIVLRPAPIGPLFAMPSRNQNAALRPLERQQPPTPVVAVREQQDVFAKTIRRRAAKRRRPPISSRATPNWEASRQALRRRSRQRGRGIDASSVREPSR